MLIAGVRIAIRWHGISPRPVSQQNYEEFLVDAFPEPPDIQVDIHSLSAAPVDFARYKRIFDSQQSWSLYRGETDYLLSLDPTSSNKAPAWVAVFDPAVTRMKVLLGAEEGGPYDPLRYPLDQLLLVYYLARRSGLLVHAAAARFGDRALVFPGKSRAGKTTLSRQLVNDPRIELLSDDRIIVRNTNGNFLAFGTPWAGEAGIAKNTSAPLRSLLFLNHSTENQIEPISPKKALEKLLPIASVPWYDKLLLQDTLNTCEDLLNRVPAYDLHFRPDPSVVDLLTDLTNHQDPA